MKRLFDIFFSLFILVILFPIILLIVFLIKIDSKGPALYFSKRVGINNTIFLMPKFRTMIINTPQKSTDKLNSPEIYITIVGKYLRKTSLDEIPQFFSVLIGKMSVVGPRPALFNQKKLISLRNNFGINSLKPGITGLAQINGRDNLSIEEKVSYDKEYLEKLSLRFDLKIIIYTIFKVIFLNNISH